MSISHETSPMHEMTPDGNEPLPGQENPAAALRAVSSAAMVNRTHRIVRERAKTIQARKQTMRELIVPLAVSAGLLAAVVFAIWTVLDEYELVPTGSPDASQQILVFLMWCLPISAAVLAVVLFKRAGSGAGSGAGFGTDHEGVR